MAMAGSAKRAMEYVNTQIQAAKQQNAVNQAMSPAPALTSTPGITGDAGNMLKTQHRKGQSEMGAAASLLSFGQTLGV